MAVGFARMDSDGLKQNNSTLNMQLKDAIQGAEKLRKELIDNEEKYEARKLEKEHEHDTIVGRMSHEIEMMRRNIEAYQATVDTGRAQSDKINGLQKNSFF